MGIFRLTSSPYEIIVWPMKTNTALSFEETHAFVDGIFGQDMHAKRVLSVSRAGHGVKQGGVRQTEQSD